MGPKNVLKTSLQAKITVKNAFSDLTTHTHVVGNAFALPLAVVPSWLVDTEFWPKWPSADAIMGPKNVSKTSLEAKITAENAFSDLGAHTNVVRGALILPLLLVWSRLVDIDFWSFWGHFGSFWGHFGVILGSFWVVLGRFGSFWVVLSPKNDQTLLTKA